MAIKKYKITAKEIKTGKEREFLITSNKQLAEQEMLRLNKIHTRMPKEFQIYKEAELTEISVG